MIFFLKKMHRDMLKTLLHTYAQTFLCLLRQETSQTICNGFEQV